MLYQSGQRKVYLASWLYTREAGRFARCPVRPESFRPDWESFRPEYEVVSPEVWSRFARSLKSFCPRIENNFFSTGSRNKENQVKLRFFLIDHIDPEKTKLSNKARWSIICRLIDSFIHPRAICRLTTRGFAALLFCSHDEAYNASFNDNAKIHYMFHKPSLSSGTIV